MAERRHVHTVCLLLAAWLAALAAASPLMAAAEEGGSAMTWCLTPRYFLTDHAPEGGRYRIMVDNRPATRREVEIKRYRDEVHISIFLAHGEHGLRVIKNGRDLVNRTVFVAPGYESDLVPEEAAADLFHTEEKEKSCQGCHRLEPTKADRVPKAGAEAKQICYPCHRHDFETRASVHKPALVQWRCLLCHQQDFKDSEISPSAPVRYTIAEGAEIAPLCYKCHKKKRRQIEGYSVIHGPVGMDGCTMCHDPHGSNHPHLLQREATDLCVTCHEMEDILQMPYVHKVITTKGCIACHDPHGSNAPLQLKAKLNDLCYGCHDTIYRSRNNHPVQGHPLAAPRDPSSPDQPLTCVSCHSPHSGEYPKLLPEDDVMMMCARCHQQP